MLPLLSIEKYLFEIMSAICVLPFKTDMNQLEVQVQLELQVQRITKKMFI